MDQKNPNESNIILAQAPPTKESLERENLNVIAAQYDLQCSQELGVGIEKLRRNFWLSRVVQRMRKLPETGFPHFIVNSLITYGNSKDAHKSFYDYFKYVINENKFPIDPKNLVALEVCLFINSPHSNLHEDIRDTRRKVSASIFYVDVYKFLRLFYPEELATIQNPPCDELITIETLAKLHRG